MNISAFRKWFSHGLLLVLFLCLQPFSLHADDAGVRWTEERVASWYQSLGWLNGINYIPSDAVNYTAMWDKTSFNPTQIEKELALAESIGLNTVRVVLQYAVYADDPAHFLDTLEKFLAICQRHGIRVVPCFFDDCVFGVNTDPSIGRQSEPLEGWYAWAWSPSPGHSMVVDQRTHPLLEKYVKAVIGKFRNDPRILLWDLYNEPTSGLGDRSLPLLKSLFAWARELQPSQPLTTGFWNGSKKLNAFLTQNADVISFHCYGDRAEMAKQIQQLRKHKRPIICTEWMNRPKKSTVASVMPLLKEERVGSLMWGLVNGKTQTHLPWGHRPEKLPYTGKWQHDLYHRDLKPYDAAEIELIRKLNGLDASK
ncbi:MAG: cellulase family glycosylhydrolase [Puniceicoccales bacterium]|jgi:hypothetical protein|nr:cellulase family glycosylhydrolase [Puniceicoccales bacterium]